jgi:hypothetical protein
LISRGDPLNIFNYPLTYGKMYGTIRLRKQVERGKRNEKQ